MKKILLKCIAFFIILILLLLVISYILVPKNNTKEAGMEEPEAMGIVGEKKDSIDVIVYGDSEPMASIMPMKIWDKYGITTYVCAHAGQTLPDTCRMVYDTLKNQHPKLVILEANNSYIPTSITVPAARVVNELLPITEYHNRWKSLKPEDFFGPINYTYTHPYKGYYYVGATDSAQNYENYMTYSEEKEAVPFMSKLYIRFIKYLSEKNGAKFMMISVPNINNWNYARHNAMKEFTEQEGIEFLDLNYLKDELNIDWQTETGDKGEHVNYKGALKVSEYLADYLNNTNLCKNRKDDPDLSKWNDDLKQFKELINE